MSHSIVSHKVQMPSYDTLFDWLSRLRSGLDLWRECPSHSIWYTVHTLLCVKHWDLNETFPNKASRTVSGIQSRYQVLKKNLTGLPFCIIRRVFSVTAYLLPNDICNVVVVSYKWSRTYVEVKLLQPYLILNGWWRMTFNADWNLVTKQSVPTWHYYYKNWDICPNVYKWHPSTLSGSNWHNSISPLNQSERNSQSFRTHNNHPNLCRASQWPSLKCSV